MSKSSPRSSGGTSAGTSGRTSGAGRRRPAFVSVDVDTIDRHLQGYGVDDAPPCSLVYERAVPRLMELAADTGVKLTFFAMGRDGNEQRTLWRQAIAEGHEVASHSWSHPQPFRTLSDEQLQFELGASRATLTAACGEEVVGFRAPAWDVDERVWMHCLATGYRYDASLFPSPMVLANRLSVIARGLRQGVLKRDVFQMSGLRQVFSNPDIHRIRMGKAELVQIPMATTPWLRAPYYHTLGYLVPAPVWSAIYRRIRASERPMSYVLHAVDALGGRDDAVDDRMSEHPGMGLSLSEKLGRLRDVFRQLAADYRCVPLREAT